MGEIQIQAEIQNRRPQDADVDSVYAEETGLIFARTFFKLNGEKKHS